MTDVVVLGAGIVGASAAYRLARNGMRVILVDGADAGQATAAGAGIVSPGTNFKQSAAFYPLAMAAVAYYEELLAQLAEDGEVHTGYETVGLLHVATSPEEAALLPSRLELVRERKGHGMRGIGEAALLDAHEAKELFPPLGRVFGALYASGAARVDGRLLRDALVRAAVKRGARLIHGHAHVRREGPGMASITVNGEVQRAMALVIAAGAWSAALAAAMGVRLPVYAQRGQILHLELPNATTSRWPIVEGFHTHYLLAFPAHRIVAGATREDAAGFDPRQTAGGIHEALDEALRVAPGLGEATVREVRVGLRPASPDQLPMIGCLPGMDHVFVVTGHGASGLQLGPYSGAVVGDLLMGRTVPINLASFAPDRFLQPPQ